MRETKWWLEVDHNDDHFMHLTDSTRKEHGWSEKELLKTGWSKRDCNHWAPPDWEATWSKDCWPSLRIFFEGISSSKHSPQKSIDLYLRSVITGGDWDEKFKRFIQECGKALATPRYRVSLLKNHRDVLSAFVAPPAGPEQPHLYRADLFASPAAFKWFSKLVWSHMRLFNEKIGPRLNKAVNYRKPPRDIKEKYTLKDEFAKLQAAIKDGAQFYREHLRENGSIDMSLRQTKHYLARNRSILARREYWTNFTIRIKAQPPQSRLAPAKIAAELVAHHHNKPEYKSLLLSGKL